MKYFISFLLLLLVYSCSTEPIEIFESVTTCEEQIANLWPFYELCINLIENTQIE